MRDTGPDGTEAPRSPGMLRYMVMLLAPLLASGPARRMPAMAGLSADFWHGAVLGLALLVGVAGMVLMVREAHARQTS
jgi:tetrahydromethanopterin S-methyltransferase subunit B